jgi:hypothetical protein
MRRATGLNPQWKALEGRVDLVLTRNWVVRSEDYSWFLGCKYGANLAQRTTRKQRLLYHTSPYAWACISSSLSLEDKDPGSCGCCRCAWCLYIPSY